MEAEAGEGAGPGAPAQAAPAPPAPDATTVYVTHREVRTPVARSGKKAGYSLSFYLITRTGGEVLAVTGKDAGDAHYRYNSVPGFDCGGPDGPGPLVDCHNRKDLTKWLEAVARASQAAGDFHVVSSDDDRAAERGGRSGGGRGGRGSGSSPDARPGSASPSGADAADGGRPPSARPYPVYIAHRSTKFDLPDGRRGLKFWLVSGDGVEYLAASGTERDARDGHYSYASAADPSSRPPGTGPMACHNMAGVLRWLEDCMARSQAGGDRARTPPPEVSAAWVEAARPAGSGGGGGGGGGGGRRGGSGSPSRPAPVPAPPARQPGAGKGIPPGAAVPVGGGGRGGSEVRSPSPPPPPPPAGPPAPTGPPPVSVVAARYPAGIEGMEAALAEALPPRTAVDDAADAAVAARDAAAADASELAARAATASELRARAARAAREVDGAKRAALGWLRGAHSASAAVVGRARAAAEALSAAVAALTSGGLAGPDGGPAPGADLARYGSALSSGHDAVRDLAGTALTPALFAAVPGVVDAVEAAAHAGPRLEPGLRSAAEGLLASWRAGTGARLTALTDGAFLEDAEARAEAVLAEGAAKIAAARAAAEPPLPPPPPAAEPAAPVVKAEGGEASAPVPAPPPPAEPKAEAMETAE